ncbi:MAG: tyrosine-type recombinase/integrase [Thermodesulfobacteriota bacterium]|nr:tyrosine-type recombinase/integrase [Thermodesulfobacteriota bacterium]
MDTIAGNLKYPYDLVVKLLYGCGLRLFECLNLRVQSVNFDFSILTIHDGIRTRMIYTHTIKGNTKKEAKTPLDF